MSLWYCQRLFTRVDNRILHEKHSCQRKETPEDVPIKDPSSHRKAEWDPKWNRIWRSVSVQDTHQYFGRGSLWLRKTCFTESLLLDHLKELFVSPPPTIHYCYEVWQDGFQEMKNAGVQFHEGIPESDHLKSWFPNRG